MRSIFLTVLVICFLSQSYAQSDRSKIQVFSRSTHSQMPFLKNGNFVMALIKTTSNSCDSALEILGIIINSKFGQILSVSIPISQLDAIQSINCISRIEVSSPQNTAHIKNDIERQLTKVDSVQNGLSSGLPKNFSGKGVIVGIVDIGFQCNHPNFYDKDGKNIRITRFWQQNNASGKAPNGFNYGTEFTDTAIIATINDLDGTHGTHVAGIAAGSGYTSPNLKYRGVAPEAELVFVSIKYSNDTLGGSALGDYVVANPSILDAYRYIFEYAASVGKPAVINLSWGMHTGSHDGTSLFDQATEQLVGPGKILVGSNGNEGDNPMHLYYEAKQDTVSSIMIENGRQFRSGESVYCDFWGSPLTNFAVQVQFVDTLIEVIAETPFTHAHSDSIYSFLWTIDNQTFKVLIATHGKNPDNLKPNITVSASHENQRKYLMQIKLTSMDTCLVHGWNSGAARSWSSGSFHSSYNQLPIRPGFIGGDKNFTAGENGGTSKAVISVGAMAARSAFFNVKGKWINDSNYVTPPDVVKFSSKGPTVDGRVKPNIVAPGYDVPSSINNRQFASWMIERTVLKSVFKNDTQYWMTSNGTSMSSPHVTGIVALMLEANPNLNAEQVKNILESTATRNTDLYTYPNMQHGFGIVNAYAAIIEALKLSNDQINTNDDGIHIYPNPVTDRIHFDYIESSSAINVEIINLNGQTVWTETIPNHVSSHYEIDCQMILPGVYILKIEIGGELFIRKLLKN